MPQKHRLRVSISLAKLPKRQRDFLDEFKNIKEIDVHSFYAHLISYFFFHPSKSLQLIGAVGKNESKIALNFHHEAFVKTLTNKTQYQRELYCLTALYEMSNMLAYKLLMYYSYVSNRNFKEVAALENQFFELGISAYLDDFIELTKHTKFFQNIQIMASSFNTESNRAFALLENYVHSETIVSATSHADPLMNPILEDLTTNALSPIPESTLASPKQETIDQIQNPVDQDSFDEQSSSTMEDWSQIQVG
ncbi:hypothetical protein ACT4XR_20235 (plasmid) [Acinetobacter baumannii]|uniref:hypothetical protein n=1 Tax=Acinetobacter baumannii TaxID=470 RepID=UPI0038923D45